MNTKCRRQSRGFTMAELLATIAILGIVAALAFVSIAQYQRSAYQQEMDETAKSIYIAAQNHLTVAGSLGTLSDSGAAGAPSKKTQGHADDVTDEGKAAGSGIYYYVVPDDKASLSNKKSMLYAMLPPGAIDETVRSDGSYIIRYQSNGTAAQVLDVFYASPRSNRFLQSGFSFRFSEDDFDELFAQSDYRDMGDAGKAARGDYHGAIIGYYGGANAAGSTQPLPTPLLRIRNEEVLAARLMNPHSFDGNVKFEFYAIGDTSGAISKPITATPDQAISVGGTPYIEVVFDSITEPDKHFAQLESIVENTSFIPGENIKIQVFALDTSSTRVSKSAKLTTNSLFASVNTTGIADLIKAFNDFISGGPLSTQATVGSGEVIAKISNIRHLENLDNAISGYDPTSLDAKAPASYEQTRNLSWPDFCEAVAGLASSAVQIHSLGGDVTKSHTFKPIDFTAGALNYKGNALKIAGVEIDCEGNAGLFGTLENGTVSNLELVDFAVKTSSGNAGALVGQATDLAVSNVLARDETSSAAHSVSGTVNAGGLVGAMAGGSVTGSAAAVYVSGGTAGGLVGSASNVALKYSYAGGHTQNGAYAEAPFNANVSGGTAGGFAGSLVAGSTATGCYSTCSVSGDVAGGFAAASVSATNCYAVGDVNGVAWGLTDVFGNPLSTQDYDLLVAGGRNHTVPYDATLNEKYGGWYPFKSIAEISGARSELGLDSPSETTLVKHLSEHYGDWPAIVTLVVNG